MQSKIGRCSHYKVDSGRGAASVDKDNNVADNGDMNRIKRRPSCDKFCLWPGPF